MPRPLSKGHKKSGLLRRATSSEHGSPHVYSKGSLTQANPTHPLYLQQAFPPSKPQKDPLTPMMDGAKPLRPSCLLTAFRTLSSLLDPAPIAGISIMLLSVALYYSSVITAGTSTGTQLGAHIAPPQTSLVKARKSIGWSHQMLKLSRVV
jgi:hypothetical protein